MKQEQKTLPGLWLHGASGRMGLEIQQACSREPLQFRLVGGSSRTFSGPHLQQGQAVTPANLAAALARPEIDVIVDFSGVEANQVLLAAARERPLSGKALLLGTTGMSASCLSDWRRLADTQGLRLLIAPNTSLGILLTAKAALLAAVPLRRLGFDIEIVETHHRAKKDAPSGTARFLADTVAAGVGDLRVVTHRHGERQKDELGVHSLRGGGVFGEHTIRILGDNEEISIGHRAFSRSLFASGALVLSSWLLKQKPGAYGLLDIDPATLLG